MMLHSVRCRRTSAAWWIWRCLIWERESDSVRLLTPSLGSSTRLRNVPVFVESADLRTPRRICVLDVAVHTFTSSLVVAAVVSNLIWIPVTSIGRPAARHGPGPAQPVPSRRVLSRPGPVRRPLPPRRPAARRIDGAPRIASKAIDQLGEQKLISWRAGRQTGISRRTRAGTGQAFSMNTRQGRSGRAATHNR